MKSPSLKWGQGAHLAPLMKTPTPYNLKNTELCPCGIHTMGDKGVNQETV